LSKLSLTKSIEARKLNPRTGVPTTDPDVTIPFGAIIDNVVEDGEMKRFTYHGEPYRCAHDLLASATEAAAAPAAPAQGTPAAVKPALRWEALESTPCPLLRAKVPGGWLVASGAGAGVTFYPDASHEWDGASLAP